MSLDLTVFKKKPILVVRGKKHFFIDRSQRAEFEALGARWKGDAEGKVHLCSGSYFVVDDDGRCRACKVARSSGPCVPRAVRVLDITGCRLPGDSAPVSRGIYERPETKTYRREVKAFLAQQPPDLRRALEEATFSLDEERELAAFVRSPWRTFEEKTSLPDLEGGDGLRWSGKKIRTVRTTSWEPVGENADVAGTAEQVSTPRGFDTFEEAVTAAREAARPPTPKAQGWVERWIRGFLARHERNRSA